ncbi:MAG: hypothetical protein KBC73_08385 [Burkholderiaceae bacterium]|nr:hypothetical protein [Burkholderiaceae bacterium]
MSRLPQAPRPDFLQPVRPTPGWAWLWLLTATTVLALGLAEARQAWQDRELARSALLRLRDGPGPVAGAATASPRAVLPAPVLTAQAAEAGRWLQRLQHPWPAVFAASEQATVEGIAWLGLAQDDSGRLQLDGLAASAEQALVAAERLRRALPAGAAGPLEPGWQDVLLARLEPVAEGQRFVLQARWAPAQPAAAGAP